MNEDIEYFQDGAEVVAYLKTKVMPAIESLKRENQSLRDENKNIRESINEVRDMSVRRQCEGLSEDESRQLAEFSLMVTKIGGGGPEGFTKGVDSIRKSLEWLGSLQVETGRMTRLVMTTLVGAAALGIGKLVWDGIQVAIKKGP